MNEINLICEKYIMIEDSYNELTREFFDIVRKNSLNWSNYSIQEKNINMYYHKVHNLLQSVTINFQEMLSSRAPNIRLISLKLIRDGFVNVLSDELIMKEIIILCVDGNNEERLTANNILDSDFYVNAINNEIVNEIIDQLWEDDFYFYNNVAIFLARINNATLLSEHINKGLNSSDKEINELAQQLLFTYK